MHIRRVTNLRLLQLLSPPGTAQGLQRSLSWSYHSLSSHRGLPLTLWPQHMPLPTGAFPPASSMSGVIRQTIWTLPLGLPTRLPGGPKTGHVSLSRVAAVPDHGTHIDKDSTKPLHKSPTVSAGAGRGRPGHQETHTQSPLGDDGCSTQLWGKARSRAR